MLNIVRKIVAGPKNRMVDQQFDLDLTYITPQIIAMAFPASGIQKTYRNSIQDVARFLTQKHGSSNYLIINASNRRYNYTPFNNQVLQFFWTDHQAPPITTLFELCQQVHQFLIKNKKMVAAIHCNHGKGRTGTAIISYLLFSGQFNDVKEALAFYNKKRFRGDKYSVDQPCQLRYLNYFCSFLQLPISYISMPLKAFKLVKASHAGAKDNEFLIRISQTRTQHIIYPEMQINGQKIKFSRPLIGDVFIQVIERTLLGKKQVIRINYNLFFLSKNVERNTYEARFIDDEIKMNRQLNDFELILEFQQFCHCHKSAKSECMCNKKREREQYYWDNMVEIIVKNKKRGIQIKQKQKAQIGQDNNQEVRDVQVKFQHLKDQLEYQDAKINEVQQQKEKQEQKGEQQLINKQKKEQTQTKENKKHNKKEQQQTQQDKNHQNAEQQHQNKVQQQQKQVKKNQLNEQQ